MKNGSGKPWSAELSGDFGLRRARNVTSGSIPDAEPHHGAQPSADEDENLDILRDFYQTTPPPLIIILALAVMTLVILGALATLY